MRITLGEVRRVVREVLAEGGYSSESSGAGFMLVDPDGRMYKAEPTRVRRWLIDNTKMSGSEREAVMSTGEVTAGVLSRMKRDRIVSDSVDKPSPREPKRGTPSYFERMRRKRERERDKLVRDRERAEKAYTRAIKDYARNWEEPESDVVPEDAASDAALEFFHTYAKEWPEWARLLDVRKSDIQSAVTDWVYDAMTKPKKTRRPSRRKVPDQMVDVDSIAPVEHPSGRRPQ
jgi:hypothetical protein